MNRIVSPLFPGATGSAIRDLQHALLVLIRRSLLLAENPQAGRDLARDLRSELDAATFGPVTGQLVERFQGERERERDLEVNGRVDPPTARALNALLRKLGEIDGPPRDIRVRGTVSRPDGRGVAEVSVQVLWEGPDGLEISREGRTVEGGGYALETVWELGFEEATLRVVALDEARNVVADSGPLAPAREVLADLELPRGEERLRELQVKGAVRWAGGRGKPGARVEVRSVPPRSVKRCTSASTTEPVPPSANQTPHLRSR